jgi:hypothetical protein
VHCGRCGQTLSGGNGRYRCDARNDGCAGLGVAADPVDQIITAFVRRRIDTPAVRRRLTAFPTAPDAGPNVAQLTARLATLAELLADGQMRIDEWRAARERVAQRIEERQMLDADRIAARTLAEQLRSVLADWDAATLSERRSVVAAVLGSANLVIMIEARSRRNGSRFDPDRVRIVRRDDLPVDRTGRS